MLCHKENDKLSQGRVVIIGAGGFVGSAVAKEARQKELEVLALHSKTFDLTKDGIALELAKVLKPSDSLVFAAAIDKGSQSGSDVTLKNLSMTKHLLTAVREVMPAHFVYVGSDAVYPKKSSFISEDTVAAPHDLYGSMHRMRELMLETEAGVPLAILRLAAVYGSGDTHNAYGPNRFVRDAVKQKKIMLYGGGEELRDHIFIEDVARLIIETVLKKSTGVLNLASGQTVSFSELAQLIAHQTGATVETAPRRVAIAHKHHDITARLKAYPGFVTTPLKVGIAQMVREIST